jgi:hypothetical protein
MSPPIDGNKLPEICADECGGILSLVKTKIPDVKVFARWYPPPAPRVGRSREVAALLSRFDWSSVNLNRRHFRYGGNMKAKIEKLSVRASHAR